eukprot:scaffold12461_cov67-Phaeocystis_antarctica.AAC.3
MATSTLATSTLLQGRCAPDLIPQGTRGRRATTTTPYPARAPSAAWRSCGATGRPACGDGARRDGAHRRIQQVRHMASWGPRMHTQVSPASRLRTPALVGSSLRPASRRTGPDQHTYDAVWPTTRQTTREGPAQRRTHNAGADRHTLVGSGAQNNAGGDQQRSLCGPA